MSPKSKQTAVYLPPELLMRLDKIASDADISRAALMRLVLEQAVDYFEREGLRLQLELKVFRDPK